VHVINEAINGDCLGHKRVIANALDVIDDRSFLIGNCEPVAGELLFRP
jgi:hypothetical protein